MAVTVGRMVAVLEAQTDQFEARMAAAGQRLQRWDSTAAVAQRSTRLLERGLQTLAFEAASIPGPIGRVGAAIGALGIGGGPILVAVAALGLFALAWKEIDKEANLAADNTVAAADRMRKNLERFGQTNTRTSRTVLEQQIATTRAQL